VTQAQKSNSGCMGCLGIIAVLIAIGWIGNALGITGGAGSGGSSGTSSGTSSSGNISGEFLYWEPVDDKRGYAYFSLTNHGSTSAVATCTVHVSNDFGNFGFDYLVGETVGAGQTVTGKIPINVGEGSLLINKGEVTNC